MQRGPGQVSAQTSRRPQHQAARIPRGAPGDFQSDTELCCSSMSNLTKSLPVKFNTGTGITRELSGSSIASNAYCPLDVSGNVIPFTLNSNSGTANSEAANSTAHQEGPAPEFTAGHATVMHLPLSTLPPVYTCTSTKHCTPTLQPGPGPSQTWLTAAGVTDLEKPSHPTSSTRLTSHRFKLRQD